MAILFMDVKDFTSKVDTKFITYKVGILHMMLYYGARFELKQPQGPRPFPAMGND